MAKHRDLSMSRRNINNYKTAKIINSKFHLLDCIYLRVIIDPHNDQLPVGPIAGRALHRHGQRRRYGSHMFLLRLPHVFVAHSKMVPLNLFLSVSVPVYGLFPSVKLFVCDCVLLGELWGLYMANWPFELDYLVIRASPPLCSMLKSPNTKNPL